MLAGCLIPFRYIAVHGSEFRSHRDSILDRDKSEDMYLEVNE